MSEMIENNTGVFWICQEVYSLHRKLSGAIWACVRLGAAIPCRTTLEDVWDAYTFGPEQDVGGVGVHPNI